MAGGIWYSQNKIRPGAYINFKRADEVIDLNSSRGIVAVALNLDFGAEDEIINLSANELASGKSLAKVGLMTTDENAKILNAILTNAKLAKIYKINKGGNKATITTGNLTITAKYAGTFGNKIAILITKDNSVYTVYTYANGYEVDTQRVSAISDLVANDFVEFSGSGNLTEISTSILLEGGTNGSVAATTAYNNFFQLLKNTKFNTIAVCNNGETVNASVVSFVKEMRNNEGKYIQAVVANYNDADYEGVINNINGAVINDKRFTAEEFTSYVAGMTAAASAIESNTGKVIEGATEIIGKLDNDAIQSALKTGKFVLSANQDGAIKVEQDINSLHTYGADLSYSFTKNRVIRTLDEIGSGVQSLWENTFLGKVSNNEDGRDLFKSAITTYLQGLQEAGAIQNFAGSEDVSVDAGTNIDAIVAEIKVQPVDSMEFLYLNVNVIG